MAEIVKVHVEAGLAMVTIDRPEALNALNDETLAGLEAAFTALGNDKSVRAVILTGAGKAFVAGADIKAMAENTPREARAFARRGHQVFSLIEDFPHPVIAAVNGFALGGGCELAMACDLRIASEKARAGQPEVKLGIIPGFGGTGRLPRLVGRGRALELLLSGDPIAAAEAHRIGLVGAVVPQAELLSYSRAWLAKALANAPLALGLVMEAVDVGLEAGLEAGLRFEAAAFALCAATGDGREGTRAFLEKRRPVFAGK